MQTRKFFVSLIVVALVFGAFATYDVNASNNSLNAYVDISIEDAKGFIGNTTELFVLDVRTQAEWDGELGVLHAADAFIPHTEVYTSTELPGDMNTPILVYCKLGGRGGYASQNLTDLGYTTVYNMAGGITAWLGAGYYVDIAPAVFKDIIVNGSNYFILDVRTVSEMQNDGFIHGATWIKHDEIIANQSLLPVDTNTTMLVYCKMDSRGSVASQTLEDLDYNVTRNLNGGIKAGWLPAGYYVDIGPNVFKDIINNSNDPFFLLDVRTVSEMDNDGYIHGATWIKHDQILENLSLLPTDKNTTMLVYCKKDGRGSTASQTLETLGYNVTRNMDGGLLDGWIPAGYYVDIVPSKFKDIINNTDDWDLLDVRTEKERYDYGYLHSSTFIVHSTILDNTGLLPTNKTAPLLVYCKVGGRGSIASQTLEDLGYTNVRNMDGGILDWIASGYYVDVPVARAADIIENMTDLAIILDVRTQAEWDAGHLENAVFLPHTTILDNIVKLPTNKSAPILVYCKVGGRGSIASQTLEDLGYTAVFNMDGGFNAWNASGYDFITPEPDTTTPTSTTEPETSTIEPTTSGIEFPILLLSIIPIVAVTYRRKK